MKCSGCQHENPESAKFCNACGNGLESICVHCGNANPPGSRFCNGCGASLSVAPPSAFRELSHEEKLKKIKRYLPADLTRKVLVDREKIEGELREVTVLFCDMVGFSSLSEKMNPEGLYSLMDEVYEVLIQRIYEYGGTVNEMAGDGIMALFGAPVAIEDAPQRAIRSASAIHRALVKLSQDLRRKYPILTSIKMRIGIHSGPVVLGALGNDLRVDFTALGDTVNLASRVQRIAEPGTTCVTDETFRLTEGYFRFEALGERSVKGKEGLFKIYQVIASTTRRTKFDVGAERGLTRFVGREREMELLLDGIKQVRAGRGQAFSIIAEAGMGKSRLLYEFRKAVANEEIAFLEGRCLSYSRGIAYFPIIDLLKSTFDIREGDRDDVIRKKMAAELNRSGSEVPSLLSEFMGLLSGRDAGSEEFITTPEVKKDRIIEEVKKLVLKGAEIRPLVIAIEDLHWVDKNSEDTLKQILDSIWGAKILLVFTYRPEFVPTWGNKSYHSQVTLNRLSNRESLHLVGHLLGPGTVDEGLAEFILQKTEGIPFFIEEFVRSLENLHWIEQREGQYALREDPRRVTIPSTIQEVIMARVDALPEMAKSVLQTGSAIEREFGHALIRRSTGLPDRELLSCLSALKDSELIYERGIFPGSTYVFKHTLTREVIYDSILARKKKVLHQQIGEALEELHGGSPEEYCEILAEHYIRSEDFRKGAHYARLARKKAHQAGALKDAISYSEKALACLEQLPSEQDVRKEILDTKTRVGFYYAEMIQFDRAMRAVAPVEALAKELCYQRPLPTIYAISGAYNYFVEENFSSAIEDLKRCISISKDLGDVSSLVVGNTWLGVASAFCCSFGEARRHLETALEILSRSNSLWGISLGKSNISLFAHNWQGACRSGFLASQEAIRFAEQSGDLYSKSVAYSCHGWSCYYQGALEEAEQSLQRACVDFEKTDIYSFWALAKLCLGLLYFDKGNYPKSVDCHRESISLFKSANIFPSFINFNELAIVRAGVFSGEGEVNPGRLHDHEEKNRFRIYEGWIPRWIAEILMTSAKGDLSEAEASIKRAVEADERNAMSWSLGQDHVLYARLCERQNRVGERVKHLKNAALLFETCAADAPLWSVREELRRLSERIEWTGD
jgi:class 3 adenylate cyclase/tetratricopeptide (TPR) repeat protein